MLARESRLTQTNEEIRVYIYIYQCHIDRQTGRDRGSVHGQSSHVLALKRLIHIFANRGFVKAWPVY